MLAEPLRNLLTYRPDGFFLVIPVCDFVINGNIHQIHPLGAPVHQLLQVILAENATDLPLRGGLVIPEVGFKAIGGEHHGAAAKLPFQTIRIQNRLFASNVGVLAGALGFHHRQGQAVLSKQYRENPPPAEADSVFKLPTCTFLNPHGCRLSWAPLPAGADPPAPAIPAPAFPRGLPPGDRGNFRNTPLC